MSKQPLPVFSAELIEMLDSQYPHRCPGITMDDREIWAYVGKRELVDSLLSKLKASIKAKEQEADSVRLQ